MTGRSRFLVFFFFSFLLLPCLCRAETREETMDQMLNDQERRALAEYRTMMHPVRESAEVPAPPAEVPAQEGSAPAPVQPEERSRTVSRELEILEQFFAKVGVETGYAHGDTTYHISSYDGASGIESELEFPIEGVLYGINAELSTRNDRGLDSSRLRLAAQVLNNNDGGSLKDSDWLTDDLDIFYTGSPNPGKDIYSESRTSLNGQSFDASYGMLFWPFKDVGFGIGPIAGYRYEYFRFKAYDTNQVGLGSWAPSETVSVTGQSIYYKVRYSVPYVGFTSDFFLKDWLRLNFGFGYSDWVVAKDRDDHLLRSKLSEGDCEGSAYLLTSSLDMEVRPDWFLSLGGEYRDIDTTGTQFQSFYDGTPDTFLVDDKITSTVWKATIGVSHRF